MVEIGSDPEPLKATLIAQDLQRLKETGGTIQTLQIIYPVKNGIAEDLNLKLDLDGQLN